MENYYSLFLARREEGKKEGSFDLFIISVNAMAVSLGSWPCVYGGSKTDPEERLWKNHLSTPQISMASFTFPINFSAWCCQPVAASGGCGWCPSMCLGGRGHQGGPVDAPPAAVLVPNRVPSSAMGRGWDLLGFWIATEPSKKPNSTFRESFCC